MATKTIDLPENETWGGELERIGGGPEIESPDTYFFYTSFPDCAKRYGMNDVVGFVRTNCSGRNSKTSIREEREQ